MAACHPWEDWAESWAHYLHVLDSLETALGFGLSALDIDMDIEPFVRADLWRPITRRPIGSCISRNGWAELTTVLNELCRSMGQPDIYPFVMSRQALRKVHFIHVVVERSRETRPDA
jgi:hypothetical protein